MLALIFRYDDQFPQQAADFEQIATATQVAGAAVGRYRLRIRPARRGGTTNASRPTSTHITPATANSTWPQAWECGSIRSPRG